MLFRSLCARQLFQSAPGPPALSSAAAAAMKRRRFLKTFYLDPTRQTGANNMRLPNTAMPDVVSSVEGVKVPVYKAVHTQGADGKVATEQVFDHFQSVAPRRMTAERFDTFVRDIVNFLDYVGEPSAGRPPSASGGFVPAGLHLACMAHEEGILEGRALIGGSPRAGHRAFTGSR